MGKWTWALRLQSRLTGNKHVFRYYDSPVIYGTSPNPFKTNEAQQAPSRSGLAFLGIRVPKKQRESAGGDTEFRKYCNKSLKPIVFAGTFDPPTRD